MTHDRLLDRLQYYLIPAVVMLLIIIVVGAGLVAPSGTLIVPGSAIGAGVIVLGFWYRLNDHDKHRFSGDL